MVGNVIGAPRRRRHGFAVRHDLAAMEAVGDTDVVGRRFGALIVDALLATAITVLLGLALADRTDYAGALRDHDCSVKEDSAGERRVYCSAFQYHDGVTDEEGTYYILDVAPAAAIAFAAGLAVFVVAPVALGASLGKRAFGLRVVRADGSAAGAGSHLVRWLLLLVDGTATAGICGLVSVAVTDGRQRVGDLVAHTYVVRRPAPDGDPSEIPT
jgi:uncharacterized RDD family membrane protein YckC